MNCFGYIGISSFLTNNLVIYPIVFFMLKEGFRNQQAVLRISVKFTGKPEAGMSAFFYNLCPLTSVASSLKRIATICSILYGDSVFKIINATLQA